MPKSCGRRKPGGARKPVRRSPRPLRLSDRALREARTLCLGDKDILAVEAWASGLLGEAWLTAGMTEREPEHMLCLEVVGRASTTPSPHGLAVGALERVGPPDSRSLLHGTVEILADSQPLPAWHGAAPHRPVRAWCAEDVWGSERVLFIEYDGPVPHTLMAQIGEVGGTLVDKLALLAPKAVTAWEEARETGEVPMPLVGQNVGDVLADLAAALRLTDMTWPRQDDEDVVALRSLARARCRDRLPDRPGQQPLEEADRARLLNVFTASRTGAAKEVGTVRSLGELFLDYGENYLSRGPLCWSPGQVAVFLKDWLPRKAVLDPEHRAFLPDALKQWVTFALTERGVEAPWIATVVSAVDTHVPAFRAAFDDEAAWGPAKQISAALAARGVDLTDHDAVDVAVRALNAERLARQLTGRPRPSSS
ncbi:hypothetical protein [Streptomyces sp. NPDC020667]|uniref:hypothetical protein n=1 Tax=Streptomyces sp. NPDC020667 TaxID=3154895 RepID=UPI0033EF80F9